jgi:hypothetical protein
MFSGRSEPDDATSHPTFRHNTLRTTATPKIRIEYPVIATTSHLANADVLVEQQHTRLFVQDRVPEQ